MIKLTDEQKNELIRQAEKGSLGENLVSRLDHILEKRKQTVEGYADMMLDKINRETIGHVLSKICRYNGWIPIDKFLSVAEHSAHLHDYFACKGMWNTAIVALLHDGTEAIFGDLISPFKKHVKLENGMTVHDFENVLLPHVLESVLGRKLATPIIMNLEDHMAKVHEADIAIRVNEKIAMGKPINDNEVGLDIIAIQFYEHKQAATVFNNRLGSWISKHTNDLAAA